MSQLSSTSPSTWTSGTTSTNAYSCPIHGWQPCNCNTLNTLMACSICGQYYTNGPHYCGGLTGVGNLIQCVMCKMYYDPTIFHSCTYTLTSTGTGINWVSQALLKEVKEITTDEELTYEWGASSFNMKLPVKFSDCFLKVGYTWSPLYPLIFSALENDEKTISFHLVIGITDKVFEGDKVVLKSVTTTKIEDNLTLLQLTERAREYLKKDEK